MKYKYFRDDVDVIYRWDGITLTYRVYFENKWSESASNGLGNTQYMMDDMIRITEKEAFVEIL